MPKARCLGAAVVGAGVAVGAVVGAALGEAALEQAAIAMASAGTRRAMDRFMTDDFPSGSGWVSGLADSTRQYLALNHSCQGKDRRPPSEAATQAGERDRATKHYVADRDVLALQATMARLDTEEKATLERPQPGVTARDVRRYLTDLPKLWRDTDPGGRRGIAEAAFDRIDAMGLDLVIHPSAEAERFGWSEACGSEPLVYTMSSSGRGERI